MAKARQFDAVFAGRRVTTRGTLVQGWYEVATLDADNPELLLVDLTRSSAVGQVYEITEPQPGEFVVRGERRAKYKERMSLGDPRVIEWTIFDGANVADHGAIRRQRNEGRANALAVALEPVRDAYQKAPANTRRAILAEVMRIVTS